MIRILLQKEFYPDVRYMIEIWLQDDWISIYHGHGLFLQFFGFFRSVEDLFTSAYYAGNQAVKQEASL